MDIDRQTKEEAVKYVKKHKAEIINRFASTIDYPSNQNPFTIIMAGSPGAGKTEFSVSLIKQLYKKHPESKIVRIDADEIKEVIPQYNKHNSYLIQKAAIIGMEKIIDSIYSNNQNALIDGTFAHYSSSIKNIKRSIIDHQRPVDIWYLYMDPKKAWDFTRKREKLEGRPIKKNDFINAFFSAKDNVNKVKKEYGKKVTLNLVIKDTNKLHLNIDNVDNYLTIGYNSEQLNKILI